MATLQQLADRLDPHRHADDRRCLTITLDQIRDALDARGLLPARACGRRQFDAHCPCHDDRRPSLSISETPDGRDLTTCHAGCEREDILRELGLWHETPGRHHLTLLSGSRATETLRDPKSREDVGSREGFGPEEEWRLRALALGISAPEEGMRFECVLPGHEHKALCFSEGGGPVRYRCATTAWASLSFAEVFLWQRTGEPHLLGDEALACRWFELLSCQAGVLAPTRVEVAIPEGCGNTVATVAEHIALYLGLRDASDGGYGLAEPFTFTRSFASDYCGVSEKHARMAMDVLEQFGSIERTGQTAQVGRHAAILWRLAK
jgi:hypothetical protein